MKQFKTKVAVLAPTKKEITQVTELISAVLDEPTEENLERAIDAFPEFNRLVWKFFTLPPNDLHLKFKKFLSENRSKKYFDYEQSVIAELSKGKKNFIKKQKLDDREAKTLKYKIIVEHELVDSGKVLLLAIPYELNEVTYSKTKFGEGVLVHEKYSPGFYKEIVKAYDRYSKNDFTF